MKIILVSGFKPHSLPSRLLGSERPLAILFTESAHSPARELAGVLENLAQEYRGRMDFLAADIRQSGEWAKAFNVDFTPAWLVIRNGCVLYQAIGSLPEKELIFMCDSALRSSASAGSSIVSTSEQL